MAQKHLFFFAPQICLLVVESRWNLLSLYLDVNQAGRCHGNCCTKKCWQGRRRRTLRRCLLSATWGGWKVLSGQGYMPDCSWTPATRRGVNTTITLYCGSLRNGWRMAAEEPLYLSPLTWVQTPLITNNAALSLRLLLNLSPRIILDAYFITR